MGVPDEIHRELADFMVNRITTPLLILANGGDGAGAWYQGLDLFLSLRRIGKEVYLWNCNGEAHGLLRRPTQKDYTVRISNTSATF